MAPAGIILGLLSMASAQSAPWEKDPIIGSTSSNPFADLVPERLGPGPHTLVISDGKGMTRMEYKSGAACKRARDSVRQQVIPPPIPGVRDLSPPPVKAFCVPR
jgi:hypothetical protein